MKLRTMILALPLAMTCSMAFADNTAPATTTTVVTTTATTQSTTAMPLSTIIKQLNASGFVCVKKIEMAHGVYEAKVLNKEGQMFKLKIDSKTGAVLKQDSVKKINKKMMMDMPTVSMEQAAANIEKAGYVQIKEIECACHHGYYKAEAINANGKEVDLEVDKITGAVSQS